MPGYLAGAVVLIGRVWDAFMDPVMGMVIDSTTAKLGKHRFWMIVSIGPFAMTFFLLWTTFAGPPWMQCTLYSFLFLVFSTAFTMYNVPFGSMTASLTHDYNERTSVTGIRMVFSLIAMVIGAGLTQLIAGKSPGGFRLMAALYGAVMLGAGLTAFRATKGRDRVVKTSHGIHVRIWLMALRNRPFMILVTSYFFLTIATTGVSGIFIYYVKYSLQIHSDFQASLIMAIVVVSAIAALPAWGAISKKSGKKSALFSGMAVFLIGIVLIAHFGKSLGASFFFAFIIFTGFGLSSFFIVLWSMVPDVVEYGQLESGKRSEGIYYGLWFFAQKLGMGISAALSGVVLSMTEFKRPIGDAYAHQTPRAISGLGFLLAGLPSAFIILGLFVLFFYPINQNRHAEIREKLKLLETIQ